jgi:hypothetical protein
MPPRWESPFDPPSPRDAALLAEVLGALQSHLTEPAEPAGEPPTPEVQQLIQAAVAELHRVAPPPAMGGVAPVLGSGVVQELLRRRHQAQHVVVDAAAPTVDERL